MEETWYWGLGCGFLGLLKKRTTSREFIGFNLGNSNGWEMDRWMDDWMDGWMDGLMDR